MNFEFPYQITTPRGILYYANWEDTNSYLHLTTVKNLTLKCHGKIMMEKKNGQYVIHPGVDIN